MTNKKLICPLCDGKLAYLKTKETHTWSCSECPYVAFEFYGATDFDLLREVLGVPDQLREFYDRLSRIQIDHEKEHTSIDTFYTEIATLRRELFLKLNIK